MTANYMYLTQDWVLRSWKNAAEDRSILFNTQDGRSAVLDKDALQVISSCDGITNINLLLFLPLYKLWLDRFSKMGIIRSSPEANEIAPQQKLRIANNPFINSVHWSITGKCNLECRHCYLGAKDERPPDLTFREIEKIISQFAEANVLEVSITGGEPFLRKDILEILKLLKAKGIRIRIIYTNGLLVSEEILGKIKEICPNVCFSLSFDGLGFHNDIRNNNIAEEKTIEAIRLIRQAGFKVSIESVLYKKNSRSMNATLELLIELGIKNWKISGVMNAGNWKTTQAQENLTVDEEFAVYSALIKYFKKLNKPINLQLAGFYAYHKKSHKEFIPYERNDKKNNQVLNEYTCKTCRFNVYLLPDGTVMPCIPMSGTNITKELPNLLTKNLVSILQESILSAMINLKIKDLVEKNKSCKKCKWLKNCGFGCRAFALIEENDLYAKDQMACHFWTNGYYRKVKKLIDS